MGTTRRSDGASGRELSVSASGFAVLTFGLTIEFSRMKSPEYVRARTRGARRHSLPKGFAAG